MVRGGGAEAEWPEQLMFPQGWWSVVVEQRLSGQSRSCSHGNDGGAEATGMMAHGGGAEATGMMVNGGGAEAECLEQETEGLYLES